MHSHEPKWKQDVLGHNRQALYIGGLCVGAIMNAEGSEWVNPLNPWRGWFMDDDDGNETGWFATADEARASVEAALKAALEET